MPQVSIVLPAFNRADTLPRAIASVVAQSFADWELIVVDDGSTDNTPDVVRGVNPRVRYVSRPNGGCYAARNTGIREARAPVYAFLDSDDEWLPHYLELVMAFLRAEPENRWVMTEFWADYGSGRCVREDADLIGRQWTRMARTVGSSSLDLAAGETDDYLRVYETREPIGEWGREIARSAGAPEARVYRGRIFRHFRWGHLGWLPTTAIRREAFHESIGFYSESYRTAQDYRLLALLARNYGAAMITVPSAIKHHTAPGGAALAESHLAAGINEYRYATKRLPLFDELFRDPASPDPETERIRGLYLLYAGRVALEQGRREQAIEHLSEAKRVLPEEPEVRALYRLARLVPSGRLAAMGLSVASEARHVAGAYRRGEMTAGDIAGKAWRRLTGTR